MCLVRWYESKCSAYRALKQVHREYVESELPLVGYREEHDGECALLVWPKAEMVGWRRSRLKEILRSAQNDSDGLIRALAYAGRAREMCVGGMARVMRNLHW